MGWWGLVLSLALLQWLCNDLLVEIERANSPCVLLVGLYLIGLAFGWVGILLPSI